MRRQRDTPQRYSGKAKLETSDGKRRPNLEEVERQAIETAILQNNGNLTAAAEQLGISRQTLYNKLKRFKP